MRVHDISLCHSKRSQYVTQIQDKLWHKAETFVIQGEEREEESGKKVILQEGQH